LEKPHKSCFDFHYNANLVFTGSPEARSLWLRRGV
jgi:hypothetical protein